MLVFINVWSTNEMMMKTQPGRHVEGKMKGWMWWRTGEGGMDDARAQTSKKRSTWPEGSRALRGEAEALRTEEGEVVGSTGGCRDSMGERERQTDRHTESERERKQKKKGTTELQGKKKGQGHGFSKVFLCVWESSCVLWKRIYNQQYFFQQEKKMDFR